MQFFSSPLRNYRKFFLAFIILLSVTVFLSPNLVSAQGLVPCQGTDCTMCHFADLANNIIKFLFGLAVMVFVVMMVVAGFGLVTSGGNPAALSDAKSKLVNAIIGLLIMFSAWLLIDTIMRALLPGGQGEISGWGPWSQIECWAPTKTESPTGGDAGLPPGAPPPPPLPPVTIPPQPAGQICYPGTGAGPVCFPAVTGIAGQPGYEYPPNFLAPTRWIDTQSVNMSTRISQRYNLGEFNRSTTCGGGGRFMYIDPRVVAALESMSDSFGVKISVNSAHRSPGCNSRIPNSSPNSMHMSGRAVDLALPPGRNKQQVRNACVAAGATFTMEYSNTNHVHCDWR